MTTPVEIFTRTFHNITNRFSIVNSLRHVAELGLPGAIPGIYQEWTQFAHQLFNDPQYDDLFLDKEGAIREGGGVQGMGRMMAENQLRAFQSAVEAASLVFAHSILDSAAMDYLRVTSLQGPNDWAEHVSQKQVPISALQGKTYDDLLKEKVSQHLETFDRQSLLAKVDKLFQVCRPAQGFVPMDDYAFDRQRLEQLDSLRHELVHGSGPVNEIRVTDNDIWFLQKTAFFLMALVNMRYDTRIDTARFGPGPVPRRA
jgi:hypothetical protein